MLIKSISLIVLLATISKVAAECSNGCSGHGKCTAYDMCICNRNWQANDCSERVCQFGLAHVDSPKGDLNMDGNVESADKVVAQNHFAYPYGTSEQFPSTQDSALNILDNTAHYYMECSNKGKCDRATGECQCFDGYDGVACQRASCPGYPQSCSGHGVCKSIKQLAAADYGNEYKLWDKDSTMGCECDAGYEGPDCSQRTCKVGVDPLYLDDTATIKYSIFDVATFGYSPIMNTDNYFFINSRNTPDLTGTTNFYSDGSMQPSKGHWAIRFFDASGEDWLTRPLIGEATCDQVVAALEALPNNVIPSGSVLCTRTTSNPLIAADTETGFAGYDAQHFGIADYDPIFSRPGGVTNHPYYIQYHMQIWDAQLDPLHGELYSNLPTMGLTSQYDVLSNSTSHKLYGHIYRLKFFGNPGKLRQPEVDVHLDGARPTLNPGVFYIGGNSYSSQLIDEAKVFTKVWTDGQQGESIDHFADHCDGVSVIIKTKLLVEAQDTSFTSSEGITPRTFPLTLDGKNISETGYNKHGYVSYLTGFTLASKQLLKTCLGDADFDTSNNEEIHNWDKGTKEYPHLIKLVRSVSTYNDGGYYAALWYDESVLWDNVDLASPEVTYSPKQEITGRSTRGTFRLVNPFIPPDYFAPKGGHGANDDLTIVDHGDYSIYEDRYEIYTTTGTFALTSNYSQALFSFASQNIFMVNTSADTTLPDNPYGYYDGDISCEKGNNNDAKWAYIQHCMNKTDLFTVLNWEYQFANPHNLNLYTATRLWTTESQWSVQDLYNPTSRSVQDYNLNPAYLANDDASAKFMTHVINTDLSTNWGASLDMPDLRFHVYKFFPSSQSNYKVVSECAGRGICDSTSGVCNCFPGYTSDSCSEQSSLHL